MLDTDLDTVRFLRCCLVMFPISPYFLAFGFTPYIKSHINAVGGVRLSDILFPILWSLCNVTAPKTHTVPEWLGRLLETTWKRAETLNLVFRIWTMLLSCYHVDIGTNVA